MYQTPSRRVMEFGLHENEPFWQKAPRYDGAAYDLAHLKPLDRTLVGTGGRNVPLRVRFSYHCCTDKPGKRDLGARVTEETRPEEVRYFCPVRWFLSLRSPGYRCLGRSG